ncbi:MAG: hypothetical protein D6695_00550 [Planctomycetota bacterium]|nr:MAG: hypothetical protein D6695_00550 [Planctomycetota bacterium]
MRLQTGARRGIALVVVVLMLAVVHITVMSSVVRAGPEADIVTLRIETARAFFAADSGVMVWLREDAAGQTPEPGEVLTLNEQRVLFVESPEAGESGTLVVEGQSGRARRRVMINLE